MGYAEAPIEQYLDWRWNFWIQLGFGALVQLIHLCFIPETRSTVLLNREAKRRRKEDARSKRLRPNRTPEDKVA